MGNCDPYSDSPEPWSLSNHSLLGSRSRHCYGAATLVVTPMGESPIDRTVQ